MESIRVTTQTQRWGDLRLSAIGRGDTTDGSKELSACNRKPPTPRALGSPQVEPEMVARSSCTSE